jgi:hypothetical protein
MTIKSLIAGTVLGAAFMGTQVAAHHSFAAQYDNSKPITLSGPVTKLDWINPHAFIFMDVKGADGKVVKWEIELGAPAMLMRNGWTRTSIKIGESVTVEGSLAKDGSKLANARSVKLANGTRVFAGSSGGDGPGGPNPTN